MQARKMLFAAILSICASSSKSCRDLPTDPSFPLFLTHENYLGRYGLLML